MLKIKTRAGKSQSISEQPEEKGFREKRAVGCRYRSCKCGGRVWEQRSSVPAGFLPMLEQLHPLPRKLVLWPAMTLPLPRTNAPTREKVNYFFLFGENSRQAYLDLKSVLTNPTQVVSTPFPSIFPFLMICITN